MGYKGHLFINQISDKGESVNKKLRTRIDPKDQFCPNQLFIKKNKQTQNLRALFYFVKIKLYMLLASSSQKVK